MVFVIFAMILLVFVVAAAWTARLLSIGLRDAQDLAAKVSVSRPISPTQWPELGIDEVMCDPETTDRVLLVVRWPAHPSVRTLMVLEGTSSSSARRRLAKWRDDGSSISPIALEDGWVALRRRQSNECVEARIVAETRWAR
jgi:hypothetical protein